MNFNAFRKTFFKSLHLLVLVPLTDAVVLALVVEPAVLPLLLPKG